MKSIAAGPRSVKLLATFAELLVQRFFPLGQRGRKGPDPLPDQEHLASHWTLLAAPDSVFILVALNLTTEVALPMLSALPYLAHLVAPYRAILRYYRCDTPYRAILFKGG